MDIINDIKKRNKQRRLFKDAIDKSISLNNIRPADDIVFNAVSPLTDKFSSNNYDDVTMLSEGSLPFEDGSVRLYIKKGAIDKFLEGRNEHLKDYQGNIMNITDNYEGVLNLGHMNYVSFPIVLGKFTRDDIKAVDIGDNRKKLVLSRNVFDRDNVFMKELIKQTNEIGTHIGLSVEMLWHQDAEASKDFDFPVADEIYITNCAIVGECGDVTASDLKLSIGEEMATDTTTTKLNIDDDSKVETAEDISADTTDDKATETETVEETKDYASNDNADTDNVDTISEEVETLKSTVSELQANLKECLDTIKSLNNTNENLKTELGKFSNMQKSKPAYGTDNFSFEDVSF